MTSTATDLDDYRRTSTNRLLEVEKAKQADLKRRDEWLAQMKNNRAAEMILVGDGGVTLSDVIRWMQELL